MNIDWETKTPFRPAYFPCILVKPNVVVTVEKEKKNILEYDHSLRRARCLGNLLTPQNIVEDSDSISEGLLGELMQDLSKKKDEEDHFYPYY